MAPTAWPSIARTDFAANKATRVTRVQGLADMREVLIRKPFALFFAAVSRTNTAYGDMDDWYVYVPGTWRGRTLYLYIEAYTSGTGAYWQVTDEDNAGAVISAAAINVTAGAYAVSGPAVIAIPAAWSDDAVRHIAIQGKAATGTIYLRNLSVVESYVTDV